MINPADLNRMLHRAHATDKSAQNQDSQADRKDSRAVSDATAKTADNANSTKNETKNEDKNVGAQTARTVNASQPISSIASTASTSVDGSPTTATDSPTKTSSASEESPAITPAIMAQRVSITYSSHFSSKYFLDEEYRAEYDVEFSSSDSSSTTFSQFSSISSSIVPLYSTSTADTYENEELAEQLQLYMDSQPSGFALSPSNQSHTPTPAIMAKRSEDGPRTFASLDNRDLPVVREYSAGGLVFDDYDRVAIIARHSRSGHLEWCLPKGHIEKGETPDQTAVREIHEETGILGEVIHSIATIDYWFTGDAQRIHKLVHHYALRMTGGYLTVEGDPDHEAEDATWVKFDDLPDVLSYPNERRIVWLYAKKHRK
ncbi:NUDIX hydrolase [Alloscardovia venturai]|uniref:NUDIX hydrolase n=1 Tax=Alloscardovia venturai TaxID=1769421 RepID=A0ABW2Y420_9BIFI